VRSPEEVETEAGNEKGAGTETGAKKALGSPLLTPRSELVARIVAFLEDNARHEMDLKTNIFKLLAPRYAQTFMSYIFEGDADAWLSEALDLAFDETVDFVRHEDGGEDDELGGDDAQVGKQMSIYGDYMSIYGNKSSTHRSASR